MGNEYSGVISPDLLSSNKISGYNPTQLMLLREKFVLICDDDLSIDRKGFVEILRVKEEETIGIFKLFDVDNSSKIDSYEFICGLTLLGNASLKEKAQIVFGLFDFDNSLVLSKDEVVVLFRCVVCSLQAMSGKKSYPSILEIEKKTTVILSRYDLGQASSIGLTEFQSLVTKDWEILLLLRNHGLLVSDDLKDNSEIEKDSTQGLECDSDLDVETKRQFSEVVNKNDDVLTKRQKNFSVIMSDIKKIHDGNNISHEKSIFPPDAKAEPDHIYGYRGYDCRNNLKMMPTGDLVGFTGKMAWVMPKSGASQKLFQAHTQEINCLVNNDAYCVTSESGPEPAIHIWDYKTCTVKASIRSPFKDGIGFMCFSNDNKMIATVESNMRHSTIIYDFLKIINPEKSADKSIDNSNHYMSVIKGPSIPVYAVIFEENNARLVYGCKKSIVFVGVRDMAPELDEVKEFPHSILCLQNQAGLLIAGSYSGHVYVRRDGQFAQNSDFHKGPVSVICPRKNNSGFMTGGYDGQIIIWENSATKFKTISLENDLKLKLTSYKIKALCEDPFIPEQFTIATKSGDVFEANHLHFSSVKYLNKGHLGRLTGLDRIGNREEFATVSRNKELIIWDVTKKTHKKVVDLDFEACQIASCYEMNHIAVGFVNGYVEILDTQHHHVIKKLKDRSTNITVIKYNASKELQLMAVGSEDLEIILYKYKDNYKLYHKIKGLQSFPIHMDFTADFSDERILQVVDNEFSLKYYDTDSGKKKHGNVTEFYNQKWESWSLPIGAQVSGLFDNKMSLEDISTVTLSPEKTILAVGMRNGDIRLYKYPCISSNPLYTKYIGHSSPVSKIVFVDSVTQKYFISIGSEDKSIIQWKYEALEDKNTGNQTNDKKENERRGNDKEDHFFRDLRQNLSIVERIKVGETSNAYKSEVKAAINSEIKFPRRQGEAPDQNLELKYIFGCKYEGITNFAKYMANGAIVFFSGNKGIVKDPTKDSKIQSFFTYHTTDILSMDVHKVKDLVATGQSADEGQKANVFVWNPDTKTILNSLQTEGTGGVIKLKFSLEGSKLLCFNNDENYTLDIFDLSTSKIISSIQTGKKQILDVSFKTENEFVTITSTSIKFWEIKGANVISTKGKWNTGGMNSDFPNTDSLVCCIYAFIQTVCFTGTQSGQIYTWQKNSLDKVIPAPHTDFAVRVMLVHKNMLYTGGDDGSIHTWNFTGKLGYHKIIQLSITELQQSFGIRSLDMNSEGVYLIGTNKAKIFVDNGIGKNTELIVESHSSRGINALAVHPTSFNFLTAGDDRTLIKWDASTKASQGIQTFLHDTDTIVALDWFSSGEKIAAATKKGQIKLFDKSLTQIEVLESGLKDPQRISVLKVSPKMNKLAFSSYSSSEIYIMDLVKENSLSPAISIKGLSNFGLGCRYIDWSVDEQYIACCLDSFEIKFCHTIDTKEVPWVQVKDKNWYTWTQPLGLYVRGLEVDEGHLKYTPVCRSLKQNQGPKDLEIDSEGKNHLFLVAGDRKGDLKLYRYPVIPDPKNFSDFKAYNSHSSNITSVGFLGNDSYIVAISDRDNSIVLFETDFKNNTGKVLDNVETILSVEKEEVDPENFIEVLPRPSEKVKSEGVSDGTQSSMKRKDISKHYDDQNMIEEKTRFTKPWLAALRYPTDYIKPKFYSEKAPKLRIQPEYVFGFRAKDTRANLKYLDKDEIIYCTACLVIIHNLKKNTQKFFREHRTDVAAFAVRSRPDLVASADVEENPNIYLWNPYSLTTIRHIKAQGLAGISKIQFSPENSNYLLTLSTDRHNTISVFSITTGFKLYTAKGDTLQIMDVKWMSGNEFVSGGHNHIKFWKIENNQLKEQRGRFDIKKGQQRIICLAINRKDVIACTYQGALLIWKRTNEAPILNPISRGEKSDKDNSSLDCIVVTDMK